MQIGAAPAPALKAFYNATRDYFTGIVAPNLGVDLPMFYTAAWVSRSQAPVLLINGIDGKLQLVENASLQPIAGTRDWGSDFAAVQSACGSGTRSLLQAQAPRRRTVSAPTIFRRWRPFPPALHLRWMALSARSRRRRAAEAFSPLFELRPLRASQLNTRWTVLRRLAISCLLAALALPAAARERVPTSAALCASKLRAIPGNAQTAWRVNSSWMDSQPWTLTAGFAPPWPWSGNRRTRTTAGNSGCVQGCTSPTVRPLDLGCGCVIPQRGVSHDCPWTTVRAAASLVVFTSDAPMPNLPALLAGNEFLVALTISADGKTPGGATGTGPFQVNGFNNGVLSLVVNDACWQGRPFVDAIEIRTRRSVSDQWLDLSAGRADARRSSCRGVAAGPPAAPHRRYFSAV